MWPFSSWKKRNPTPPHALIVMPDEARVGERVHISGQASTGDIVNWRIAPECNVTIWGPGDIYGFYEYSAPGVYYISLVVIGPTGLVAESSHRLTVYAATP